jgi:hypothetical protein
MNYALSVFVIAFTYVIFIASYAASSVIKEGGKIYIVDRRVNDGTLPRLCPLGMIPTSLSLESVVMHSL